MNWNPKQVTLMGAVDQPNVLLPMLMGNWQAAAGNAAGNALTTALGLTGPWGAVGGFLLGGALGKLFGRRRSARPPAPNIDAVMSSNLAMLDAKRQKDLYQIYSLAEQQGRNMYQSALAQVGNNRQALNAAVAQIAPRIAEFLSNALASYYQAESQRLGQSMQAILGQDELRLRERLALADDAFRRWQQQQAERNAIVAALLGGRR